MRSSSASIDLWIAIIIPLLLVSCASSRPSVAPSEGQAELIGTVTISGEHPYERQLVLADTTGVYWLLEAPEFEGELLELGGQRIRALGIARTESSGNRSMRLRWYDLSPLPGTVSGVGILERWGDDLVLFTQREGRPEQGQRVLIIDGPLRSVLELHLGYRIWVAGESAPASAGDDAAEAMSDSEQDDADAAARISLIRVVVSEYGVLGPPIPSFEASPRSTRPD
jgi:hypothetical protein